MDTIQCAVVLAKLEQFDWELGQRQEIGARYSELLMEKPRVCELITVRDDRTSVLAQYSVLVEDRESVQDAMKGKGVPSAVHYPIPLNEQPAYRDLCCPDCTPVARRISGQVLSLPMGPYLSIGDQRSVVKAVRG